MAIVKNKKLLIVFMLSLVIVIAVTISFFIITESIKWSEKVHDFMRLKNKYEIITTLSLKEMRDMDADDIWLSFYRDGCRLVNGACTPAKDMLLTEVEQNALKSIYEESFRRGNGENFDGIHIGNGYVSFRSINGRNFIIYSYEGKNPEKDYPGVENGYFAFKKASKNWYYVRTIE